MESYNAVLITQGKSQSERMEFLRELVVQQLRTLDWLTLTALPAANKPKENGEDENGGKYGSYCACRLGCWLNEDQSV